MDEEIDILRDRLKARNDQTIAHCEFSSGTLAGCDVVLLKCGIGKVNAALGTTLLINLFHPDFVVNTGSAGGCDASLNVGDVVVSNEVRHHDVDVTAFGYEYGQVPSLPAGFTPDTRLGRVALNAAARLNLHVVEGLILSGDAFMNDAARVRSVRDKFPKAACTEMEGAAIAQVCHQFEAPFLIIRSLSDIAGKNTLVTYEQFLETASKNSAGLVLAMIEELRRREHPELGGAENS
jgi:adenosylhomocysteine nucleosidase